MSATGFAFANPQPSPDDFNTFDPQDVYADSGITTTPVTEAIPAPWKNPPVMALADVLGSAVVQQIQKSGEIVFHAAGDTGGIKEPSHQFAVGDALSADIGGKITAAAARLFYFIWETLSITSGRNATITISITTPIAIMPAPSSRYPETTTAYSLPASRYSTRCNRSIKIFAASSLRKILRPRASRARP